MQITKQLRKMFDYIENYRVIQSSYDPPCVVMTALTLFTTELDQPEHLFRINIHYPEDVYQEIVNTKDFSFETFFSGVGGCIGIFLGYSLLQVPEILSRMTTFLRSIPYSTISSKYLIIIDPMHFLKILYYL